MNKTMHTEGVREEEESFALSPLRGADDQSFDSGGLRFAPTPGYFRATLRVAKIHHGCLLSLS